MIRWLILALLLFHTGGVSVVGPLDVQAWLRCHVEQHLQL